MDDGLSDDRTQTAIEEPEAIQQLRRSLEEGRDWSTSLLEAMALWTVPQETHSGRDYNYFIGGEAFDWLLLAERLCEAVDGLLPEGERDELLFTGQFPSSIDETLFKDLLGIDKYRGYLNHFYGVTVEEALQIAAQYEVQKRLLSNGNRYQQDFSEEAYVGIYRAPRSTLLEKFREEKGYSSSPSISLTESNEFTYWLFRYRLKISDNAKTASDTRKGLQQLQKIRSGWPGSADSESPPPFPDTA